MRVPESLYRVIHEWSNPSMAKLLYYVYGPINMDIPLSRQKVKYTESRRLLNEYFVMPNLESTSTSYKDRYNLLKQFKFDPDIYINYLGTLIDASSLVENIITNDPYSSGILMGDNNLNFVLQFNLFSMKMLKESLESLKSSEIWNH